MIAPPAIYRMTAADRLRLVQAWRRMTPAQRALILARFVGYQIARVWHARKNVFRFLRKYGGGVFN